MTHPGARESSNHGRLEFVIRRCHAAVMASKKSSSKGKRYTRAQKRKIIAFVDEVNAEKGRGGQAAASKKFGISPLTISSWIKKGDVTPAAATSDAPTAPTTKRGTKAKASVAGAGGRGKALAQLNSLHDEITRRRKELDQLEAKFQKIKDSL